MRAGGNALAKAGAMFTGWQLGYNVIGPILKDGIDSAMEQITGTEGETLGTAIYSLTEAMGQWFEGDVNDRQSMQLHLTPTELVEQQRMQQEATRENTAAVKALAQRPVTVVLDGKVIAQSVNNENDAQARRQ